MNTQNFFDLDKKETWSEKTWEVYNTITINFIKKQKKSNIIIKIKNNLKEYNRENKKL